MVVGLVVAAYCLALRRYGLELADEGTLLAQIDRVAHGQIPYRDFHTGYGPGLFYANAGLFAVFGPSIGTVRMGLAVVQGVRAMLLARLAGRIGPPRWWVIAALALVAFFLPIAPGVCTPFLVPYAAWYAGTLGLAAVWMLASAGGRRGCLVVGMLWGAAFAFKQNTGLLGLGAAAAAIALLADEGDRSDGSRALGALLGVCLLAGGLALLRAHLDLLLLAVMIGPIAILAVALLRSRPRTGTVADLATLAAGFVSVALPVGTAMGAVAGAAFVATDLLQIGTNTALVYHVPYPTFDQVREALAGAGGTLRTARQLTDLSWFVVFPVVHLAAAVLIVSRRVATRPGVVVATAAIVGFLELYPRMDGWHLLPLAPASLATLGLVLATSWPLVQRAASGMLVAASIARMLPVLPVLGALAAAPPELPHVPRLDLRWDLLEPPYLRRLPDVIEGLQGRASVVTFPALGVINFALGTPSPFRHDYFFPGRPEAAEEAALVLALRSRPPATVVVLDAPVAFFPEAGFSHPEIVATISARFATEREIGPYRILVPRGGS